MSDEWRIYRAEGEMDLDLDELEATADAYGDGVDHAAEFSYTFDDQTVKALIARVRRAEFERDHHRDSLRLVAAADEASRLQGYGIGLRLVLGEREPWLFGEDDHEQG